MKAKIPLILSILALVCPVAGILIMCLIEPEVTEAVLGGLLFGCVAGSIPGAAALILNKNKNKLVKALSVLPMCPLAAYIVLAIPYLLVNLR